MVLYEEGVIGELEMRDGEDNTGIRHKKKKRENSNLMIESMQMEKNGGQFCFLVYFLRTFPCQYLCEYFLLNTSAVVNNYSSFLG